jgi:hypothetical protein
MVAVLLSRPFLHGIRDTFHNEVLQTTRISVAHLETHLLHGAGIFTNQTGGCLGEMLVNIPAPWSIWESFFSVASESQLSSF